MICYQEKWLPFDASGQPNRCGARWITPSTINRINCGHVRHMHMKGFPPPQFLLLTLLMTVFLCFYSIFIKTWRRYYAKQERITVK